VATTSIRKQNKSLYWAWKSIKQRCNNQNCTAFKNYGARGIRVTDEWDRFEPFYRWAIESGYKPGLDIDRINNDGDYSPENCRWVSRRENVNNRRRTVFLTVNGETHPRTVWEELAGIPHGTVKTWITAHGKEYAEARIAEAIDSGYVLRDFKRNHVRMRVLCVETSQVFPSAYSASKEMGLNRGNLVSSIKRNGTVSGFHFVSVPTEDI